MRRKSVAGIIVGACVLPVMATGPALADGSSTGGPAAAGDGVQQVPGGFLEGKILSAFPSAQVGGDVSAGQKVTLRVYLAGQDPQGLEQLAEHLSDPHDPAYGKFLSAREAASRFGPDEQQRQLVTDWLRAAGLTPGTATNHYIAVTGTAGKVEQALGTTLKDVTMGGTVQVPTAVTPLSVPAKVADAVLAVGGLAPSALQGFDRTLQQTRPIQAAGADTTHCSQWFGQNKDSGVRAYDKPVPWELCSGYSPQQIRTAYGLTTGDTGRNATVGVILNAATKDVTGHINAWAQHEGVPQLKDDQYKEYLPDSMPADPGVNPEQVLDLESAHAMAPDADLAYIAARSPEPADYYDALARAVDDRLADVVSNSWYLGMETQMSGDVIASYEQLFQLGAVEGVGFTFGSGDWANNADIGSLFPQGPSLQYPASDPWVTAVGGTSLVLGKDGSYQYETGWGTAYNTYDPQTGAWSSPWPGTLGFGAGGGPSNLFAQPGYQQGIVPAPLSTGRNRSIPDIAADADGATGMAIGYRDPQDGHYVEDFGGGTSMASPMIAAMLAVLQQHRQGIPVGFANPALYARAGSNAFHDITDHPNGPGNETAVLTYQADDQYTLDTFGHDQGLTSAPGYDTVTGIGTPTPQFFTP
ncbi:S53 family peptidase [Streptomyces puniciscabiei]